MLLLRIGRRARWGPDRSADHPAHVADAALDLALTGDEQGLSVYRVEGGEDAAEIALRDALTCRESPVHMDYVVFPDELAKALGLAVRRVPAEGMDPLLNARQHEVFGLTPELQLELAAAILACGAAPATRIPRQDLARLGAELCRRDPGLRSYLKGTWVTLFDEPERGTEPTTGPA